MNRSSPYIRKFLLYELLSGVLLFGALREQPALEKTIGVALTDLRDRGYTTPSHDFPVSIAPAAPSDMTSSHQGGSWSPGVIKVRPDAADLHSIVRHELMHESSRRTCEGKLPIWAEEAAAISFSGELDREIGVEKGDLPALRQAARFDSPLPPAAYRALKNLLLQHQWPKEPCQVSEQIRRELQVIETPLSYVLLSVHSGRVLESHGDLLSSLPPGSLMKLPFVAALSGGSPSELGDELLRSDSESLLRREGSWDSRIFHTLVSVLEQKPGEDTFGRWLIGERNAFHGFDYSGDLTQIALMVRGAVLTAPNPLLPLRENGKREGSTLYGQGAAAVSAIQDLSALAKTGTVSNENGSPLFGYIALIWPAIRPEYVAIARQQGVRGATVLTTLSPTLTRWRKDLPKGTVRVQLFSGVPNPPFELMSRCERLEGIPHVHANVCGEWEVKTTLPGAKKRRFLTGIIEQTGSHPILITDPETYADAVVSSEADTLVGEARKAFRSIVTWNGLNGIRHEASRSLCDLTHCMVFLGTKQPSGEKTDVQLLRQLDHISRNGTERWFQFSKGGSFSWSKKVDSGEAHQLLEEPNILDIQRNRASDGSISIHILSDREEEIVPCESLQRVLKLPNCPQRIQQTSAGWIFEGQGEGHSIGLDIEEAGKLSRSGATASELLKRFLQPEHRVHEQSGQ